MILYQLLRPIAYLRIDHPSKWKFDWLVPACLTAISLLIMLPFLKCVNVFGGGGLVEKVASFVQILPGFYIAALAAIATFNRQDVDRYMPQPTPKLDVRIRGNDIKIELTRRRFLCLLFAFLTAESLALALIAIFSVTMAPVIAELTKPAFHNYLTAFFLGGYLFLLWQMLTATALGLYYLGDRLNQPDP